MKNILNRIIQIIMNSSERFSMFFIIYRIKQLKKQELIVKMAVRCEKAKKKKKQKARIFSIYT
jgi:hypothetical protein